MTNWKEVVGFEGLYQVSDMGEVRSLDRYVKNGSGLRMSRGRPITPKNHDGGYRQVTLFDKANGRSKRVYVHKIVMEAFVGDPLGMQVDHINADKTDNRLINLRYVTPTTNSKAIERDYVVGEPKLSPDVVRWVRYSRALSSRPYKEYAAALGVSVRAIQKICKRENWPNTI